MKIILNLIVAAFLTTVMFSCKKEMLPLPEIKPAQSVSNQFATDIQNTIRFIPSDWFPVTLKAVATGSNFMLLSGEYTLPIQYIQNDYVHLAYTRVLSSSITSAKHNYTYTQLPATITTANEVANMNFSVTGATFILTVTCSFLSNTAYVPDFGNYEYRHIEIPSADYKKIQIDWSDYKAVAAALNFPL